MTVAFDAVRSEDLGGGFRYSVPGAGSPVIVAGALAPLGFHGLMSPASVNARDASSFREWVESLFPGSGPRLRGVDQVHSASVVGADSLRGGNRVEADGMVAASAQDVPVIMAADCAPVWLVDPKSQSFALVHAGWRGIAAGIIEAGVRACLARGAAPENIVAAVGPHLQPCCFEVGPEVARQFKGHTRPASELKVKRQRSDSAALDISSAITARLKAQGVNAVHASHACTRCRADILHSYRRNGKGGPLMGAIVTVAGAP